MPQQLTRAFLNIYGIEIWVAYEMNSRVLDCVFDVYEYSGQPWYPIVS